MRGFYRGCLRFGAAILFALALAQFLAGLVSLIYTLIAETGRMASNYSYIPDPSAFSFAMQLQVLIGSMSAAAFPFFGALVIDRLDRWLALKDAEASE